MAVKKILVVDDSPTDLQWFRDLLSKKGFEVLTAVSGEEGVSKAKAEMPDLVLMDVVMPGLNGFQATREIVKNDATKHIPVILCTNKTQETDRIWGLKQGANRRLAGEDAKEGAMLLEAGARLRPQDVASAAATGLGQITCYAKLKVAILSTGDEILRPGESFSPGKVYDANAPMLEGLIRAAGAEAVDLGVLADKAEKVKSALADAASAYDAIVISGGASQGAEDHVVDSIDALGKRHLWQIAIKPGRPMSFGQIGDCVVLGLPGNPVAVFVCFLIYVRPVLARLAGGTWPEPVRYPIAAAFARVTVGKTAWPFGKFTPSSRSRHRLGVSCAVIESGRNPSTTSTRFRVALPASAGPAVMAAAMVTTIAVVLNCFIIDCPRSLHFLVQFVEGYKKAVAVR
jgi:molybdenum cofactor synthesis domain-containing protein